jgi:hypothetical protein
VGERRDLLRKSGNSGSSQTDAPRKSGRCWSEWSNGLIPVLVLVCVWWRSLTELILARCMMIVLICVLILGLADD